MDICGRDEEYIKIGQGQRQRLYYNIVQWSTNLCHTSQGRKSQTSKIDVPFTIKTFWEFVWQLSQFGALKKNPNTKGWVNRRL